MRIAVRVAPGRPTCSSRSRCGARRRLRPRARRSSTARSIAAPTLARGLSEEIGILEHDLRQRRETLQRFGRAGRDVVVRRREFRPRVGSSSRTTTSAERRLAASAFADEAQRLARADRERDAVDRPHLGGGASAKPGQAGPRTAVPLESPRRALTDRSCVRPSQRELASSSGGAEHARGPACAVRAMACPPARSSLPAAQTAPIAAPATIACAFVRHAASTYAQRG